MSHTGLRLLGNVEITGGADAGVELTSKKAQALLAFLLQHPDEAVPRDRLAGLLWSETANEFARTNLRQSLAILRKLLANDQNPSLRNEGTSIRLVPGVVRSDVQDFEAACDDAGVAACKEAVKLYRGDFLAGIDLDPDAIQDWIQVERRRLEDRFLQAAHKLLIHHEEVGADDRVQVIANRLLTTDPVDESAHRALMRLYDRQGRRAAMVRQFELCRDNLQSRLGIEPSQTTADVYRQLLDGDGETPAMIATGRQDGSRINPFTTTLTSVSESTSTPKIKRAHRVTLPIALAAIAMLSGWLLARDGEKQEDNPSRGQDTTVASATRDGPSLSALRALDNRPAIAVLPFRNLDDAAEQDYFSDGLSEDLITDLSQVSGLRITAWASSVAYRDPAPDVPAIAEALGVRYVLLGSVRKVDDRVRINAQLVDAETRTHRWAERYDREISDVLQLQDEIARTIVGRLSIDLTEQEQDRLERSLRVDADAYDLLLRGLAPLRQLNREGSTEARRIMQRVIEIDPSYARAWANLALSYAQDVNLGFTDKPDVWIERGFAAAEKARELDASLPQLLFSLSMLNVAARLYDEAINTARSAIASDPNYADGYGVLAQAYLFDGQLTRALEAIETAKWLNPRYTFTYLWVEGQVHLLNGDHERARTVFEEINARNPSFVSGRLLLISTYGHLGLLEDAEWQFAELLTLRPDVSLASERAVAPYRRDEHTRHYVEGLRLAGLGS